MIYKSLFWCHKSKNWKNINQIAIIIFLHIQRENGNIQTSVKNLLHIYGLQNVRDFVWKHWASSFLLIVSSSKDNKIIHYYEKTGFFSTVN